MESLKKIINLNQAAKISGYTQDYLGYLIRQGEMKGKKVGRSWVTTEEELKKYIFKQKIRHNEIAIRDFASPKRLRNIFLSSILFIAVVASAFLFLNKSATNIEPDVKLSNGVEITSLTQK